MNCYRTVISGHEHFICMDCGAVLKHMTSNTLLHPDTAADMNPPVCKFDGKRFYYPIISLIEIK